MRRLDVPYIDQSGRYPTGCESVSAVMLLRYLGCSLTVDEFIGRYLKLDGFERRNGELFGPDPNEAFCGSPYDPDSFGCYAPVIRRALAACLGGACDVIDETGAPMERLLSEYIDQGMPVVFWACINMREPVVGPSWRLKGSGKPFTWISNEHCMLLVGYDEESYIFNDPYGNNGVIRYPRAVAEERHKAQHSMAVGVKKRPSQDNVAAP